MVTIPGIGYKTRLLIMTLGVVILLWSSLEDHEVLGVTVLGWITAGTSVCAFVMSRFHGTILNPRQTRIASLAFGAGIGAGASLATALLMLFKDIRHAHLFPDYPLPLIQAMLERLPVWSIGCALIALAITLVIPLFDRSPLDAPQH